jgi:hypothetical protein
MITTPTVLVLGAGASSPYGFPTAKELEELICEKFKSPETRASVVLSSIESPYSAKQFFEFREAFLRSPQSIDAFLQRRPEFLEVGKLAIAYCLIPFENEANLYRADRDLQGGNWYKYLAENWIRPSRSLAITNSRLSHSITIDRLSITF